MDYKGLRSLVFFIVCLLLVPNLKAQSVVSGEVDGTVTDPTGAVVPNAKVNLVSSETGFNETTTTGDNGTFRFALVKPGKYTLTITAPGFNVVKQSVVASLGQVASIPVHLEVGSKAETIEITGEAPLLHTENANLATSVDAKTIDLIPSPGQDITNYAMTTPGVTLSTGGGYGNFTANGLPGTSNLYTVNGNDYNDPYLNLNNSGASNLLLGANELQEITVVTNGYTGEYGRAAGANVNYTTKSGTNQFHGNATWFWNGTMLNANDYFANSTSPVTPRPHAVSNQWAGSIGGPIKKDKLFFFYDNEGLRYVLPGGGGQIFIPTPEFATATLANLQATSSASVPFYTSIFKLYAGASGAGRATTLTAADDPALGCGDLAGTTAPGGGVLGTNIACARTFQSTVNNLNTERLQSFTVDFNATSNDTLKFRYKQDRGVQATGTDPINSVFNANSVQPEDDGQVMWTHIINNHTTNQFIASGLYYSAIFGPPTLSQALATFRTTLLFNDGAPFTNLGGGGNQGGGDNVFPQGRNVTQWQLVDDFSWTKGAHGIKFGVNFRRNDITSFAAGPGTSGLITENSMTEFYNGTISAGNYAQTFANAKEQPVAYFSLGLYLQDEWRVNSKLKLTLALRSDVNSNEVCQHNCFSRPTGAFTTMNHNVTTPYSTDILTGLHDGFPNFQKVAWGPRGGFAWSVRNDLVVRGGVGLFSDLYQGLIADRFITNLPNVSSFTVTGTGAAISPDVPNNIYTQAAASNAAFQNAYNSGGTLASIQAVLPGFTPPNLNTIDKNVYNPRFVEWNLQIEKSFGANMSFSTNYVGNHGSKIFVRNLGVNTFCSVSHCPNGFDTLPSAAPDARFGVVTNLSNAGLSNYDGLTLTLVRRFSHGFQGTLNYTYSHSLDDVSNGGLEPYNGNNAANSFRLAIDPNNLRRLNYANSDYNYPHAVSANYFWELPIKSANHFLDQVVGGWTLAGTFFFKSGEQFSVYDTRIRGRLGNGASTLPLAFYLNGPQTCSAVANLQCLQQSQFAFPATSTSPLVGNTATWGNVPRNFFRGPSFFDSDLSVQKNFKPTERMTFTLGANAFNIFNHPNFDNPHGSITSGTFGQLFQTVTPPNSPYGNFQGAVVSGRVLQLDLKFRF